MTKYSVKRPNDTVEVLILPNKDGSSYQYVNLTKGHICPCKFKTEIDALRDMDKKISEGKVLCYEEIEKSEWHNPKEKLPTKDCEVLIEYGEHKTHRVVDWNNKSRHFGGFSIDEVTRWKEIE